MKIIITENQLKDKVHQMVKTEGWRNTSEILGLSGEELAQMFFNNDPMEFLNQYNDLEVVQSETNKDFTLFRYKPEHNLMIYDRKNGEVSVNWQKIWSFLKEGFDLNYDEIQEITQRWLAETYNLNAATIVFQI